MPLSLWLAPSPSLGLDIRIGASHEEVPALDMNALWLSPSCDEVVTNVEIIA